MKNYLFIAVYLVFSACSVNPVTGKQDFVMMTENEEIDMGKRYHSQVLNQIPPYQDTELQDYVQRIGDSLSSKSHRPNLFYRFTVLDSPDINAFALPGGYIYINRGLMAYLSSEEELAAVLGHEIGHVTARHSVRQYSQSQLLGILSTAIEMNQGRSAGNLANLASGVLLSGYGREMELEADDLGAQYIAQEGYSPQGMFDVLSVLKDQEIYSKAQAEKRGQEPVSYHGVFASHPSNDKRLQEILEKVTISFSKKQKKIASNYLNQIEGMVYGDSEQSGVRRGNEFFHSELDLYFSSPDNWEIINTPQNLIFTSPTGEAVLQINLEDLNFRESPRSYMDRVASNHYGGKELNVNGFDGYTALSNRSGRTVRLAIIFKEKQIYQFIGYLKEGLDSFNKYDSAFLKIINTFNQLDERGRELSKPLRIKKYIVKEGDTYRELAKLSKIHYNPEDQLRLLNGDFPDDKLFAGESIKLVQ
tara:strand:- start:23 stop:1447 length:1425 start_codon:yes stop_codon:yes gene_type:complete